MINNKIKLLSGVIASIALLACSSMETDDPIVGNWPAAFQVSEYSEINPDIALKQLKDTVTALNVASGDTVLEAADIAVFFDDSLPVKTMFTDYASLNEALWPGFEDFRDNTLQIDLRNLVLAYHIHGNTATQDLAFLQAFPLDSSLIAWQYLLYGKKEGRAYRYCEAGEATTLKSTDQAVAVRSLFDYSANVYCLNESDDQLYLVEK